MQRLHEASWLDHRGGFSSDDVSSSKVVASGPYKLINSSSIRDPKWSLSDSGVVMYTANRPCTLRKTRMPIKSQ